MTGKKSVLLWIVAVILMLGAAVFQRYTGPTHPYNAKVEINNSVVKSSLPRSHGGPGDEIIQVEAPDNNVKGTFTYKRYKSYDEWKSVEMTRKNDKLEAAIPHQPIAGKVMYTVSVNNGSSEKKELTEKPLFIRFRGDVPAYILIPHIFLMFLAMCFSTRAGFEAFYKGSKTYSLTLWTIMILFIGGMILGSFVQKYAFGVFWSGVPFGFDLTDNKTLIALVVWLFAYWRIKMNPNAKGWVLAASIVMLIVFLIPHSVLGSEIDYTKMPAQ